MKKEADVKKKVKEILTRLGAWYYMPVPTGYGRQGVPDFLVCLDGLFVAIETKFGSNKPTSYQELQISEIRDAGGLALVINEKNVGSLEEALAQYREEAQ